MDVVQQTARKNSPEVSMIRPARLLTRAANLQVLIVDCVQGERRGLHRPRLQDVLFDRSYSTTSDYDSNREVFDSGSWSSHGSQPYQVVPLEASINFTILFGIFCF